mmetsp:Transcript_14542/g.50658  ORF Transcript_14542/g.50658 Transcript_14542/m.50658 type:complete len:86 (+) Transcript_14542:117-374(+)
MADAVGHRGVVDDVPIDGSATHGVMVHAVVDDVPFHGLDDDPWSMGNDVDDDDWAFGSQFAAVSGWRAGHSPTGVVLSIPRLPQR